MKVGDGLDKGVQIGPVSNRRQYDTVIGLLQDASDPGYDILTGELPTSSGDDTISPLATTNGATVALAPTHESCDVKSGPSELPACSWVPRTQEAAPFSSWSPRPMMGQTRSATTASAQLTLI